MVLTTYRYTHNLQVCYSVRIITKFLLKILRNTKFYETYEEVPPKNLEISPNIRNVRENKLSDNNNNYIPLVKFSEIGHENLMTHLFALH